MPHTMEEVELEQGTAQTRHENRSCRLAVADMATRLVTQMMPASDVMFIATQFETLFDTIMAKVNDSA